MVKSQHLSPSRPSFIILRHPTRILTALYPGAPGGPEGGGGGASSAGGGGGGGGDAEVDAGAGAPGAAGAVPGALCRCWSCCCARAACPAGVDMYCWYIW